MWEKLGNAVEGAVTWGLTGTAAGSFFNVPGMVIGGVAGLVYGAWSGWNENTNPERPKVYVYNSHTYVEPDKTKPSISLGRLPDLSIGDISKDVLLPTISKAISNKTKRG